MADLHPEVERMIQAGRINILRPELFAGDGEIRTLETEREFARRVALIAHAEGFAAGARAQREMEPTAEMVEAGCDAIRGNWGVCDVFLAMQRVAPLVGGEG